MTRNRPRGARTCAGAGAALCALTLLCAPSLASAEPRLAVHVEAGAARAVGDTKSDQFGWGGVGLVAPELQLAPAAGLEVAVGAVALGGDDEAPPAGVTPTDGAVAGIATLGARFRPLALVGAGAGGALRGDGLWIALGLGGGVTSEGARPALRAAIGYDVKTDLVAVGPSLGFLQVVEPDRGSLRPEDARVAIFGIHGQIGGQRQVRGPSDADGDGILDASDACIHEPEDRDGVADGDGCPESDDDRDGIADMYDQCLDAAEDRDGFADRDGCPDLDDDRDGIADAADACPRVSEDLDGRDDHDGCPDLDDDRDGIADATDQCPAEAETPNGIRDDDGCPDRAELHVVGDRIILDQRVHFPTWSAVVPPEDKPVLRLLALFLNEHPAYRRLGVAGHADDVGPDAFNMSLSRRRAEAVIEVLVRAGVDRDRLEADAHGEAAPRARGTTQKARSENRRVELRIVKRDDLPIPEPSSARVASDDRGAK